MQRLLCDGDRKTKSKKYLFRRTVFFVFGTKKIEIIQLILTY